jgi:hypothetical protein
MAAEQLEVGMLLYEYGEVSDRGHVWTVKSVGKRSARVVCHTGSIVMDASLTSATLPEGWRRINHAALVAHLAEQLAPAPSKQTRA